MISSRFGFDGCFGRCWIDGNHRLDKMISSEIDLFEWRLLDTHHTRSANVALKADIPDIIIVLSGHLWDVGARVPRSARLPL